MASSGKRTWLYVRMGGLGLVILFALQLFIVNVFVEGQARVMLWWASNFWSLVAAFAIGLLLWPLAKAVKLTWNDYEAAQREAAATAAGEEPSAPPSDADEMAAGREHKAAPGGGSDAADVWTSGEEEQRSR